MANRLHPRVKRTHADIQQCKDCKGNASMPNPARPTRLMDCPTCNGQGIIPHRAPYRLTDGTWSDGIDRSERIRQRFVSDRYEVTTGRFWSAVWHGDEPVKHFDKFTEAIRYADHHARTTKNGDA